MVVVVGAGLTGLGVARDLVLRGIPTLVIEQGSFLPGTSGRFHGLLHSGARYAVTDPEAARECWQENQLLKRWASAAIEDTGGLFVSVDDTAEAFEKRWLGALDHLGIPVEPVFPQSALDAVPDLNPRLKTVYRVPDAVVNSFRLSRMLERDIRRHGGQILTHTRFVGAREMNGEIREVIVESRMGLESLPADAVINAAGPWAGQAASLMGLSLSLRLHRGTMIVFAHRRVGQVVNRLAPPGDGDIMVPHQAVMLFGTTDVPQDTPEAPAPPPEEVQDLMRLGRDLFPGIDRFRVLRAFTGVRPLYDPTGHGDHRRVSRDFTVLDHRREGGMVGAFTIVGGKLTTFRAMAQAVVDGVVEYLGQSDRTCATRDTPVGPPQEAAPMVSSPRVRAPAMVLCECEQVTREQVEPLLSTPLADWRLDTWLGMGPCQGTFCAHRAAGLRALRIGPVDAQQELLQFRQERLRGFKPVAWGDNLRELHLQRAVSLSCLAETPVPESEDEP